MLATDPKPLYEVTDTHTHTHTERETLTSFWLVETRSRCWVKEKHAVRVVGECSFDQNSYHWFCFNFKFNQIKRVVLTKYWIGCILFLPPHRPPRSLPPKKICHLPFQQLLPLFVLFLVFVINCFLWKQKETYSLGFPLQHAVFKQTPTRRVTVQLTHYRKHKNITVFIPETLW